MHSIVQSLFVKTNAHYSIDFVLSRGATFKGQVLDDATGQPIKDAFVYSTAYGRHDVHTDENGSYEFSHIAADLFVGARTTNHVAQTIKLDAAAEGSTVSVPDIRLRPGGWISGRVERPAEVESNTFARVTLEIQGYLQTNSVISDAFSRVDGTFRTDPSPSGTYTLHAEWQRGGKRTTQTWQATGSVSNINVIVGRDTTNVFIPAKMTIQTNGTGGR